MTLVTDMSVQLIFIVVILLYSIGAPQPVRAANALVTKISVALTLVKLIVKENRDALT